MTLNIGSYPKREYQHTADFSELSTEKLRRKMQSRIDKIYQSLLPGCEIKRESGSDLDRLFGIDTIIYYGDTIFTVQEKCRENQYLINPAYQVKPPYPDFTQEFKNASNTPYERDGEWFHLASQLYWYGWSNSTETDLEKWVLMDVYIYKAIVINNGGLEKIGVLRRNFKHGKASFYAISIYDLLPACIKTCGFDTV